ncbi:MAG: monovalent cation/H+ antiporter complex subunit F [Planctomycetota bacterium]
MLTPDIHNTVLQIALTIVAIVLGISMLGAFVRLVRGPSLPDRVVALDLIGYFCVGIICIFSIAVGRPVLLSVALVMALILFLGTAAFALFLERRARP